MARLTEDDIRSILTALEALLRSDDEISIDCVVGHHEGSDDSGGWKKLSPNGTHTITIKVNGGARNTSDEDQVLSVYAPSSSLAPRC